MHAILNRLGRDGIGGAAVMLIGIIGLFLVRDYPVGTLSEFGSGFVPWVTTLGMAFLGAAMVFKAWQTPSGETIRPEIGRPLIVIPLGMACFAFGLEPLGLAVASAVSVFVSSFASRESGVVERILIALGLATLVTAIFSYGLGMTMPRWPWFMQ
jgi:hypothetical protein